MSIRLRESETKTGRETERDRERGRETHRERGHPVFLPSVHANEKAVSGNEPRVLTFQNKMYSDPRKDGTAPHAGAFIKNLSVVINAGTFPPPFTRHQFEGWISPSDASTQKKVVPCCKNVFTSAHEERYIVANQEKRTTTGDIEGKTNGVVHR